MLGRLLRAVRRRFDTDSVERGGTSRDEPRSVDHIDGMAARSSQTDVDPSMADSRSGYPPGYVKGYDEGRPRT